MTIQEAFCLPDADYQIIKDSAVKVLNELGDVNNGIHKAHGNRGVIDRLKDLNVWSADKFIEAFVECCSKTSSLPSTLRSFVESIGWCIRLDVIEKQTAR